MNEQNIPPVDIISPTPPPAAILDVLEVENNHGASKSPTNKQSRIPQPVRGGSLDEMLVHQDGVMRVTDLLRMENGAMNRASTDVSPNSSRTPRYGLGAYQSYEELLRNIEETDPFHGEPPPPSSSASREKRESNRQSKRLSRNDIAMERMPPKHVDEGNYDGVNNKKRHHKKQSHRDKSTNSTLHKNTLNSTYTKEQAKTAKNRRPESAKTYILERTDSQAALIPDDERRISAVKIVSARSIRKKILMDRRKSRGPQKQQFSERKLRRVTQFLHLRKKTQHQLDTTLFFFLTEEEVASIREYVTHNIKHRQCCYYIKDSKSKDKIAKVKGWVLDEQLEGAMKGKCQCGREYAWHEVTDGVSLGEGSPSEKWNPEKHSRFIPADSYGTIQFSGFGQETTKLSHYVRVDYKTEPKVVWELLSDHWQLPNPKLIISVTGGAKRFFMKSRLKTSFKRGLINAATTTGAWIVTGGTNAGVMEFVGEAVRDHMMTHAMSEQEVVALGIATWGIVDNKESLMSEEEEGMFPAHYNIDDLSAKSKRGVSPLDHNHTHFILVDNGTDKKFGVEIKFRAALEHYISEMMETGVARNQSVHVPVVLLVLEGGENTLQTTAEAMIKNTPVVVIQGSGRAADFIAYAYRITRSVDILEEKTMYPGSFEEDLRTQAQVIFDWSKETDLTIRAQKIDTIVENMRLIMDRRRLLTVFNLDDADTTNEIDQAILYALLKANRSNAQSQLNLALAWNRCDVARTEIFNIENRAQWQKMNLYEAMLTALVQDRADFVQLFLDNGVDLKRFLTVRRLRDLYDDVIHDRYAGSAADLLRHLLQHVQQSWMSHFLCCKDDRMQGDLPNLLGVVGKVLVKLLGDQAKDMYAGSRYIVNDDDPVSEKPTISSVQQYGKSTRTQKYTVFADFTQPERELFYWAILLNRRELALLFWRQGKDHIGAALTGSALLKGLAEKASSDEELDLATDLMKHAQLYENMGIGVLNECYQKDKLMTHQLLTRELTTWGSHTLFMIVEFGEQMDFMEHSACQTKLNKIWKGKMALYTSTWKILLVIFFPVFLPLIKFTPFETLTENNDYFQKLEEDDDFDEMPPEFDQKSPAKNKISPSKDSPTQGSSDDKEFVKANPRRKRKMAKKLYEVALCSIWSGPNSISLIEALYYYHTAPVTKFWCHTFSYIAFLLLFSFFVLTDLHPMSERGPGIIEYIVWGWNVALVIEEARQLVTKDSKSVVHKVSDYFMSVWNRFDMATQILFILSICLRLTLAPDQFQWARMAYATTVAMFFLRFMQVFFVEKNIGPQVIMISRMLTDLLFFIAILVVVILAYGVASQALRYPNSEPSWSLILNIFYLPYWQMYGELFLEDIEGEVSPCSKNLTEIQAGIPRCPEKSWLVLVIFGIYMIMTNVLLLNLLIAMFSYTFERVQENSEKVWRFYRYALIYEYFDRPTLAPPLIILSHLWRILRYLIRRCRNRGVDSHDFRNQLADDENKKLTAFEKGGMENYLLKQLKKTNEHIDAKVTNTGERLEKVIIDLEQIKEQVTQTGDVTNGQQIALGSLTTPREPLQGVKYDAREDINILQSRMTGLEEHMQSQSDNMRQIMMMLQTLSHQHPRAGFTRSVPEPQIEIKEMGETGSSMGTLRQEVKPLLKFDDDDDE